MWSVIIIKLIYFLALFYKIVKLSRVLKPVELFLVGSMRPFHLTVLLRTSGLIELADYTTVLAGKAIGV